MNRRTFVKTSALMGAGFIVSPQILLAAPGANVAKSLTLELLVQSRRVVILHGGQRFNLGEFQLAPGSGNPVHSICNQWGEINPGATINPMQILTARPDLVLVESVNSGLSQLPRVNGNLRLLVNVGRSSAYENTSALFEFDLRKMGDHYESPIRVTCGGFKQDLGLFAIKPLHDGCEMVSVMGDRRAVEQAGHGAMEYTHCFGRVMRELVLIPQWHTRLSTTMGSVLSSLISAQPTQLLFA